MSGRAHQESAVYHTPTAHRQLPQEFLRTQAPQRRDKHRSLSVDFLAAALHATL